jgi:hypothetical protein
MINIMFGFIFEAPAVLPILSQPDRADNADAEPAISPIVFRNSLLVCFFIFVPFFRLSPDF